MTTFPTIVCAADDRMFCAQLCASSHRGEVLGFADYSLGSAAGPSACGRIWRWRYAYVRPTDAGCAARRLVEQHEKTTGQVR